jgi:hypothetical protein
VKTFLLISFFLLAKFCLAQEVIEGNSKPAEFIVIDEKVNIKNFVKYYVEEAINVWQKKEEFEKLADYKVRTAEANRDKMINYNTNEAINLLKAEHLKLLKKDNLELHNYDTENQSFLISTINFGDFTIPVPSEFAPNFKKTGKIILLKNQI